MIINRTNTQLFRLAGSHLVKAVYDTGQKDADGAAVTVEAFLPIQALELSKGVMLPKARVLATVKAALEAQAAPVADVAIDVL